MGRRATSRRTRTRAPRAPRRRNVTCPGGRKFESQTTFAAALKRAHNAGAASSALGSDFTDFLCVQGLANRSPQVIAQLRAEFDRGVEANAARWRNPHGRGGGRGVSGTETNPTGAEYVAAIKKAVRETGLVRVIDGRAHAVRSAKVVGGHIQLQYADYQWAPLADGRFEYRRIGSNPADENESVQDRSYREWAENFQRVQADPTAASEQDLRRAIGYLSHARASLIRRAQEAGRTVDPNVLAGYDNDQDYFMSLIKAHEQRRGQRNPEEEGGGGGGTGGGGWLDGLDVEREGRHAGQESAATTGAKGWKAWRAMAPKLWALWWKYHKEEVRLGTEYPAVTPAEAKRRWLAGFKEGVGGGSGQRNPARSLADVQAKISALVDQMDRSGNTRARAEKLRQLKEERDRLEGVEPMVYDDHTWEDEHRAAESARLAGLPRMRHNPAAVADMTPGQINKELAKLDAEDSRYTQQMIDAGRGNERPSDYLNMTDPLSLKVRANYDRRMELVRAVQGDMGPGYYKYPDGWRHSRRGRRNPEGNPYPADYESRRSPATDAAEREGARLGDSHALAGMPKLGKSDAMEYASAYVRKYNQTTPDVGDFYYVSYEHTYDATARGMQAFTAEPFSKKEAGYEADRLKRAGYLRVEIEKFKGEYGPTTLYRVRAVSPNVRTHPIPARARAQNPRRNPEGDAGRLYEEFHGRPSEETLLVETEVHEHDHLTALGDLTELVVETPTGLEVTVDFLKQEVLLCSSEDGRQLYFEGGDQSLDLSQFEMDGDEWVRDLMVLGKLVKTTYRTQKAFDKFKTIDYYHENGEESGVTPELLYDPISKLMRVAGGQYFVKPEGIVN